MMELRCRLVVLCDSYMEYIRFQNDNFIAYLDDLIECYKLDYDLTLIALDCSLSMGDNFYIFRYDYHKKKVVCLLNGISTIMERCYMGEFASPYNFYIVCMSRRRKQIIEDLFSFIDV